MTTLLPCPFCGGKPRMGRNDGDYERHQTWWIECEPCCLLMSGTTDKDATIAAWNRRTAAPSVSVPFMQDAILPEQPQSTLTVSFSDEHIIIDAYDYERRRQEVDAARSQSKPSWARGINAQPSDDRLNAIVDIVRQQWMPKP